MSVWAQLNLLVMIVQHPKTQRKGPDKEEFVIRIELENDAFQEDRNAEIATLLREIADAVAGDQIQGTIRDINGNTVGSFGLEKQT